MATLVWSATTSLDGFVAGPGGNMAWLTPYVGPNPVADGLVDDVGALLVGRRTFDGDDPNRGTDAEGAFGGLWSGPQVVLTHRIPDAPVPDVTFVDDLDVAVATARAAAGDRAVHVLGADVARQCLLAGLLDEVLVFVAPVLIGDGTPLFSRPGGATVALEPVRSLAAGPVTAMWFRVPGR